MDWDDKQLTDFVVAKTGETAEREIEGPVSLGRFTVWRYWTYDSVEYHAHYVIAEDGKAELVLKRDFPPFALWLAQAFNASDTHARQLDWFRSLVAAAIIVTLLALVVWAVIVGKATSVDFRWLVGALAATSLAYLLGGWTRKRL